MTTTETSPGQRWQTVYRNVSSGGRVVRVGGIHTCPQDARAEAARRNERDNRHGRNVSWTTREIDENGQEA